MRLAVVNLGPQTGKTVTAAQLAASLAETGPTLLVDADPRQAAFRSAELGLSPGLHVVSLPARDIHRRMDALGDGYAHVVLDTPAGDLGIVCSALLAATQVLVPASPRSGDLPALGATLDLVRRVGAVPRARVSVLASPITDPWGRRARRQVLSLFGEGGRVLRVRVPGRAAAEPHLGLPSPDRSYRRVAVELLRLEPALQTDP